MNTLQRTGVAVGLGLVVYASGPSSTPFGEDYPSGQEMNDRVEACAVELGGIAVEVDKVPEACEAYAYLPPFQVHSENSPVTFTQPSQRDFRFYRTVDEAYIEQLQTTQRRVHSVLGCLAAIGTYAALSAWDRKARRDNRST